MRAGPRDAIAAEYFRLQGIPVMDMRPLYRYGCMHTSTRRKDGERMEHLHQPLRHSCSLVPFRLLVSRLVARVLSFGCAQASGCAPSRAPWSNTLELPRHACPDHTHPCVLFKMPRALSSSVLRSSTNKTTLCHPCSTGDCLHFCANPNGPLRLIPTLLHHVLLALPT